ncbi:MAG TPA: fibronectin type III domain-containing protein [Ideonella sp.]|nr:fibronectin type III domain-containing protein [Ideonella sp.]
MRAFDIKQRTTQFRGVLFPLTSILFVALTACGGGGEDGAEQTAAATETRSAQTLAAGVPVTWLKITDQNASFHVVIERMVRFGSGTTWVKKKLIGTYVCNAATFGSDPAPGVAKTCEIKDADPQAGVATLTWTASLDSGQGYRVYYGTASRDYKQPTGTGINAGKVTSFTLAGLPAGQLHYFSATAVDSTGSESTFSNEVSKLVQ